MLIEKIKEMSVAARKAKTSEATFLVTLLGEASRPGKDNGNRLSTDEEVLAVITKFKKGALEMLKHTQGNELKQLEVKQEIAILDLFLPKQMSEEELENQIRIIVETGATQMGQIMAKLKADFEGCYDGKTASSLVKKVLAS